jgi:hypothetical protein
VKSCCRMACYVSSIDSGKSVVSTEESLTVRQAMESHYSGIFISHFERSKVFLYSNSNGDKVFTWLQGFAMKDRR